MENPSTATMTRQPRRAGAAQGALLLAGSCLPVLGSVLITPVLPQLSEEFAGITGAEVLVPMIVALPALMIALFAPFAGQIVDRVGRKALLIGAMFVYAVAGTAPAWLTGLIEILISRVLVGVCEAAIMTVCTALIVDYFHEPTRRRRYLGLQVVATTLAATVFIALGGALGVGGWHVPFWVYAVSVVLAVPMIFLLWEPADPEPVASDHTAARTPWRRIAIPLLVTLFGGFTFYVLFIELSYLVVATGVSPTDSGTIGAVSAAASGAVAITGITFALFKRVRPGALLPVAFALQAVGMLVMWLVPGLAGIVTGAVIASFGSGFVLPSLLTWVVAATAFEERGRVTGWWTAAFFLGQFLTPIVMGILVGLVGSLAAAVGVVGVAAAIVGAGVFMSVRSRTPASV
jgi:MFS family permease